MRWLLFLSRLAFICGICFLLSISLLIKKWISDEAMISTIITIGVFMGMLVVPLALIGYLLVLIRKKALLVYVPLWLVISNILFLIALLVYIILINGQNHSWA